MGASSACVANLEAEAKHSREQLGKVKATNDMMWEKCVQKAMPQRNERQLWKTRVQFNEAKARTKMM